MSETFAEHLLRLARCVKMPSIPMIEADPRTTDAEMAVIKLALQFESRGPAFALRAIFEGWSRDRCFQEVY